MTASSIHTRHDGPALATGGALQPLRALLGVVSAGIGIYQIAVHHGVAAALSFFMAATFLLSVACDRGIASARQQGIVVPTFALVLAGTTGMAIGGAVVLGVLVALSGL